MPSTISRLPCRSLCAYAVTDSENWPHDAAIASVHGTPPKRPRAYRLPIVPHGVRSTWCLIVRERWFRRNHVTVTALPCVECDARLSWAKPPRLGGREGASEKIRDCVKFFTKPRSCPSGCRTAPHEFGTFAAQRTYQNRAPLTWDGRAGLRLALCASWVATQRHLGVRGLALGPETPTCPLFCPASVVALQAYGAASRRPWPGGDGWELCVGEVRR